MKWKTLIFPLIFFCLIINVYGVNNNTNVTLKSSCINLSGRWCSTIPTWTVIDDTGKAVYNQTVGQTVTTGIHNLTVWFNKTGTWWVLANYSAENFSQEWNVIVEDYKTQNITSIEEGWNMTGILILYGLIVFAFLYAGFNLDQEHKVLKILFILLGLLLAPVGLMLGYVALTATTLAGLTKTFKGIFVVGNYFLLAFAAYVGVYLMVKLIRNWMDVMKQKKKGNSLQ